ncbi:MAG: hypothetical protein CVV64_10805 [Candidatus Wallbacteria bacterium HGW-Wallbacteria-1]|jgi:prepilin-type N-terminal cleavage/methylation domain-containing protein|uniref:Type II secretion system protein J n=1 Tax=Candidatus Wallbacteria bacterium HGW-Wallbacteria-1 TaxID=2013854 RepID=A0A2N1PPE6_9BACT|nr:MAG: hypothetical protein CVV64_10805 [Candidatus Wallbacteria bacterium HGW-Wallbacteria-1]
MSFCSFNSFFRRTNFSDSGKSRFVIFGIRGFTAAELIVATAVFSILAGMVYQFFKFSSGNQKRLDADSTALQQANVAIMRMVKEISEARAIIYPAAGSTSNSLAMVGRKGSFLLFTLLPRGVNPNGPPGSFQPSGSVPGHGQPGTSDPSGNNGNEPDQQTLYMCEIEAAPGPAVSSGPPIEKWKKMADRVITATFTTHEVRKGRVPCMATIQLKVFNSMRSNAAGPDNDQQQPRSIDYLTTVFCRAATEVD